MIAEVSIWMDYSHKNGSDKLLIITKCGKIRDTQRRQLRASTEIAEELSRAKYILNFL
jgi:hypothetical protein